MGTFSRSWFVQSLELLFAQQFSKTGKVWKMEIKSEQMVKSVDAFFFKAITSASLEVNFYFSVWSNLIQSRQFVCSAPEQSCVSSFLRSLLITYLITLSLKKNIIVLGKSPENVLEFGSKNLYESWQVDCLQSAFLFKFRRILIPAGRFSNSTPSIAFCWLYYAGRCCLIVYGLPFSFPEPVVSWSRVGYKLSRVTLGTRMMGSANVGNK